MDIAIVVCILAILLYSNFRSPFSYPYFTYKFDVSGKRSPQFDDLLDAFLISGGFLNIQSHQKKIDLWKQESNQRIAHSFMKEYRRKQYLRELDDNNAFVFHFVRFRTGYYLTPLYTSNFRVRSISCSYEYIQRRYRDLEKIGFKRTLREHHVKRQRKLVTQAVRKRIMIRDHYTCQICRKYMPNGVGIHIDHIIPVSKGGMTVDSNLRVLCARCNGSKSDK